LAGKSVCLLFYEPSTRTRVSFGQAAQKLGAWTEATENAKEFSSAVKGESMYDTGRVINSLWFDALVVRGYYQGQVAEAADAINRLRSRSRTAVINAGDGPGQHPTQALLDGSYIHKSFGTLDGLRIALVGDLESGRTARSLGYLASKFDGVHIDLVAPSAYQMKSDLLEHFDENGVSYSMTDNLLDVADKANVIYLTRLQTERKGKRNVPLTHGYGYVIGNGSSANAHELAIKGALVDQYQVRLNQEVLSHLQQDTIVMHPLPRSDDFNELPEEFTDDPHVRVFEQVEEGLFTRMALLDMIINGNRAA
jgi:aspartate carbamoyltransferase catalytic subunit